MFERCAAICRSSTAIIGIAVASFATLGLSATPASAWRHHHHRHHWPMASHYVVRHARPGHAGNIAAIVIDENSGRVLYSRNENELRHPASITKVMTLYLLFEQLEKGRLHLDSRLRISAHAAAQAPTKLGLEEGDTISVEDAIKAVVTKSANDIAVAIAEAIGGDERSFAEMMTRKAHALGMMNTRYVNASGLPDDEQITTARDLAVLGRAIQERFPHYYHYFSTRVFYYHGVPNPNHNHLLGRVDGMDGIKTGYTRSSGFNLLTSVRRNGHHIVAVVLGGVTAASRDRIMADLIEQEIDKGSTVHTAPAMAENAGEPQPQPQQIETADFREFAPPRPPAPPRPLPEPEPRPAARQAQAASEPAPPDPVQVASISDQVPVARPRPAFVAATPKLNDEQRSETTGARRAALDGSTQRQNSTSTTPSNMRWIVGPAPAKERAESKEKERERAEIVKLAKAEPPARSDALTEAARPASGKSGWMIQIGATDDLAKANQLLARAKAEGRGVLSAAQPFTEKVQKGSETLYRARFAGIPEDKAEAICKTLKRSGFACFATRN